MDRPDPKALLHRYLRLAREALLWKLEGLGEYDVRRPLTPTGTNLLGLVKHLAIVETGYLGTTFDRPFPETDGWLDRFTEPDADMWATPEESRAGILDLYARATAHGDATVDALDLDAVGHVPHWPEDRAYPTLALVLVHLVAETNRHAGHADVVRELIDGAVGMRRDVPNLGGAGGARAMGHHARLDREARRAARMWG